MPYSGPVHAYVLAGGQSTRMGRDKALLSWGGHPLIARMVELARAVDPEPRICGSRQDLAQFAEVVADQQLQCGPLAGIAAGLEASDAELNLFLPVDMPGIPPDFLCWLRARAEASGAVATIPRFEDRPQPLCAIYSRRLREGVRAFLDAGQFKVMAAIRAAAASLGENVDIFAVESVAAALPAGMWPMNPPPREWFRNANTPGEYAWLRRTAGDRSGADAGHPIS